MKLGVFYLPDPARTGSLETLCKIAVRDLAAATCIDALQTCLGARHGTQAQRDESWLEACLSTTPGEPSVRISQALSGPKSGIDPGHGAFAALSAFLASL